MARHWVGCGPRWGLCRAARGGEGVGGCLSRWMCRSRLRRLRGMGLVPLGLVGLIFSPIPVIGLVAWPLVVLGLIFSFIGLGRCRKGVVNNRGLAIAGLVTSAVGLVVCVVWVIVFGKAVNDVREESNREAVIRYEVPTLPWTKEVRTTGLGKGGTLTVGTGAEGGTVTCHVYIDGKEAETGSASGPLATANCTGF